MKESLYQVPSHITYRKCSFKTFDKSNQIPVQMYYDKGPRQGTGPFHFR